MKIAMVSEHASPPATLGGVDAGGQNVHVAALARALAAAGHEVEVYTRRHDPALPDAVVMAPGVSVLQVPAGPPRPIPKEDLLPYMADFGRWLARRWTSEGAPDVVHAHFWTIQTLHLIAIHALCAAVDEHLAGLRPAEVLRAQVTA